MADLHRCRKPSSGLPLQLSDVRVSPHEGGFCGSSWNLRRVCCLLSRSLLFCGKILEKSRFAGSEAQWPDQKAVTLDG